MKPGFLYSAINDTQGTIKALDVKLGFLFVIIFAPLTAVEPAFRIFMYIQAEMNSYMALCYVELFLWFFSVIYLFLGVSAISNPEMIKSNKSPFYDGDIFEFSLCQSIFENNINPKKTVAQKIKELPRNENELIETLVQEKIKLAYIRDLKIKRSAICTILLFIWLILGSAIWALVLANGGLCK